MDKDENKNLPNIVEKANELGIGAIFKGDDLFIFIYKKTQKILSALYLITNLFSDQDPIKWTLRTKGGQILEDVVIFFDTKNEADLNRVKSGILETLSLLEVGEVAGLIGPMNARIIRAEFRIVFNTVSGDLQNRFMIPSHFFEVGPVPKKDDQKYGKDEARGGDDMDKGHHIGHSMSYRKADPISRNSDKDGDVKDIKSKERRDLIISIIRKKREVNIRDIKDIISDCSAKTIQRDLLNLVAEGVLKKVGERRWSRYQII